MGIQVVYFAPIACLTTCLSVAYSGLSLKGQARDRSALVNRQHVLLGERGPVLGAGTPGASGRVRLAETLRPLSDRRLDGVVPAERELLPVRLSNTRVAPEPDRIPAPSGSRPRLSRGVSGCSPGAGELGLPRLAAAILIGTLASILFAGACAYLWVGFGDRSLRRRMIGFVMIGAYSLGTGLMVMPARLGFGIPQALSSRYSTFSLYLLVSLIYLTPIVLEHARANGYLPSRVRMAPLASAVVAALLLVHALTATHGMLQARAFRAHLRYFKACLLFVNVLRSPAPATLIPSQGDLIALANALNRLGYLRPSLIDGKSVEEIAMSSQDARPAGEFGNLVKTPDGRFIASGWAVLPERTRTGPCRAPHLSGRHRRVQGLCDRFDARRTEWFSPRPAPACP